MTTLPGPGALIRTNYDPTVLRVEHRVPHPEQVGWWCFLCVRADDPRRWRHPSRWHPGQGILHWYRLEDGRLLGRRFLAGQAGYHAIVGRDPHTGAWREGPPEVRAELLLVTPERQLALFAR